MNKIMVNLSVVLLVIVFFGCNNKNNTTSEKGKPDSASHQNTKGMKSYISIFEIPATDISRAILFYENILAIDIERMEFQGMEMGILPYEEQIVTGVIIKGEDYQPSENGVTVYLNGGDNLQTILDKVEKNGGKIVIPKTPHADESGYFAIFLDTEGNKLGLHSVN